MKRYIKSNSGLEKVRYEFIMPRTNRKYRFAGEVDMTHGFMWGDIQRIAAYDDADYYWAKVSGNRYFKFIHDGKVVDKMQVWAYDDEDYEDINDYFSYVIMEVIKELDQYNDSISPRMMYN